MRLVLVPLALIGVVAALGAASRGDGQAPAEEPEARLVEVGTFEKPVHVASPPGDERLFVVEQAGRVRVLVDGRTLPRPFLDISRDVSTVGFEEGLLSLAFAPDFARSGRFYVDYTDHRSRTVVEEFRVSADPNVADPRSRRQVLVVENASRNHHGGHILFGPDGLLWISQGEGTTSFATFDAQDVDTLHGKILRIDPRPRGSRPYGIPPDNPFVGRAGRDEVWAYGLRNPWRIAFEPETEALLIGDVGRLSAEEIDVAQQPGLNFGWSCFEAVFPIDHDRPLPPTCAETVPPALGLTRGSSRVGGQPDATATVTRGRPLVDARLRPGDPGCSITLGVFVEDPALPGLRGRHLFGDFCGPALRSFRLEGGEIVDLRPEGLEVLLTSSFGVDSSGRVYVTSLAGPVYRVEPR